MKTRPVALAVLLALAAVPAAGQTLYKCVVDGKTAYQSEPCAPKASQSEIRAPRSADSLPAPAPAAPGKGAETGKDKPAPRMNRQEMEEVIETFVGYAICNEADPGFGAKLETGFQGWRERHADSLQRFNQDPEAAKLLDARLQAERQRQQGDPAAARAARTEMCVRTATRIRPIAPQPQ